MFMGQRACCCYKRIQPFLLTRKLPRPKKKKNISVAVNIRKVWSHILKGGRSHHSDALSRPLFLTLVCSSPRRPFLPSRSQQHPDVEAQCAEKVAFGSELDNVGAACTPLIIYSQAPVACSRSLQRHIVLFKALTSILCPRHFPFPDAALRAYR